MSNKNSNNFQMFKIEDLCMIEKIGEGSFGEVFKTKKEEFGDTFFATKKVKTKTALDEKNRKYFNNEIYILRNLQHENIIEFYEIKRTSSNFYLVFGFCNGGMLSSCLKKYQNKYNRPFTEEECRHLLRQITSGLAYLDRMNIIHRDLKLDNILVNFKNDEDKEKLNMMNATIKIIDFGFARFLDQSELANSILGSPMNMDPTLLGGIVNKNYVTYDEKADIWSLATIAYNLFTGYPPFTASSYENLYKAVSKGNYNIPLSLKLSKQALAFLVSIMQNNPNDRLDIKSLVYHEFLMSDEKEQLNIKNISNNLISNGELKLSTLSKNYDFLFGSSGGKPNVNFQINNNLIQNQNNLNRQKTKFENFDLFNQQVSTFVENPIQNNNPQMNIQQQNYNAMMQMQQQQNKQMNYNNLYNQQQINQNNNMNQNQQNYMVMNQNSINGQINQNQGGLNANMNKMKSNMNSNFGKFLIFKN